jgi:hypothetical protein
MNLELKRQACYNVGLVEPISIEPDGTVWTGADDDRTYPDAAPIDAEYARLVEEEPRAQVEAARLAAYEKQSDPLYFKWQRGDGTEQEWLDAVAAVKTANPYPPAP